MPGEKKVAAKIERNGRRRKNHIGPPAEVNSALMMMEHRWGRWMRAIIVTILIIIIIPTWKQEKERRYT